MNSSQSAKEIRRRKIDELVTVSSLQFPLSAWSVTSTPSVAAARRKRLIDELSAKGMRSFRALRSLISEPLEPVSLTLEAQQASKCAIIAKSISLDDWPSVVEAAPWVKGAKLRIYIDHEDQTGLHLIADLYFAPLLSTANPSSPTIGVAVHGPYDEEAVAELRPNFTTRVFSRSIHGRLDDLAVRLVAA